MAERKEIEINGRTYVISTFDAFLGLKIGGDLQRRFLAPMLGMLDGKEAGTPDAVTSAMMGGVEKVLREVDGDALVLIAKRLLFGSETAKMSETVWVEIEGDRRKLDIGAISMVMDVADLIELCIEIAKLNWSPLFSRLASRFGGGRLTQAIQSGNAWGSISQKS